MDQVDALSKPRDGIKKLIYERVRKASLGGSISEEKPPVSSIVKSHSAYDYPSRARNGSLTTNFESSDEGIGLMNSSFESLPFIDDQIDSEFPTTYDSEERIEIIEELVGERPSLRTLLPCRAKDLKAEILENENFIQRLQMDTGTKPKQRLLTREKSTVEENMQTWKKLTKKLIISKQLIKEQDQKKQLKKMWKENYAGMCNRALVLDQVVTEASKQGIKIKPLVTTKDDSELGSVPNPKANKKKYIGLGKKFYGFHEPANLKNLEKFNAGGVHVTGEVNQTNSNMLVLESPSSHFQLNIRTRSVEVLLGTPARKIIQIHGNRSRFTNPSYMHCVL